jgi:hypothetical protein
MHGYLAREGLAPAGLIAAAREEVRSYGSDVLVGLVSRVTHIEAGDFRVELVGGRPIIARRVSPPPAW